MTISDRSFSRFVLFGLGLGFLALIAAVAAASWGFVRSQEIGRLVAHTYEVELSIARFMSLTERAETSRRGFLLRPDDRFVETFRTVAAELPPAIEHVGALTVDNPRQVALVDSVRAASARQLAILQRSMDLRRTQPLEAAAGGFASDGGAELLREIRSIGTEMTGEERRLLAERTESQGRSIILAYVILAVSAILLLAVAVATFWAVRRNLAEVKSSRDRLRALNDTLELAVVARTADLQLANDEIQRFAYIVSHDLRSPLVNVMGFTAELDAAIKPLSVLIERAEEEAPEIVTEDARLAVREDLPEAIGFIRSSTQKMDRLINAILRLSREGRRVITPEHLDVTAMLQGIADSLQFRLGELGAEIAIEAPLPDIVSDRVGTEQIFSNLLENAVKYLKPGRPGRIRVRGRREGDRVLFEVEDNGRGIDPKDHERIFDLFRRSGAQDQPGEGIGLAHVRALAYRLGGTVRCRSELDEGATFVLSVPRTYKESRENRG